jgi:hypothetical protein
LFLEKAPVVPLFEIYFVSGFNGPDYIEAVQFGQNQTQPPWIDQFDGLFAKGGERN